MTELRAAGFIFDMDGTVVDNMRFHDDAWEAWHGRYALPFDRPGFFARTAGRTNPEIIGELFPGLAAEAVTERGQEKEALYRSLYAPHLRPLAGFLDMLDAVDRAGAKAAVATAAPPPNIDLVLDGLGLRERFAAVASPALGLRGKPHPDIFLAAAERMGVAPADCIVFEDAPLGVEAARRGGMRAVAITTTMPAAGFSAYPNVVAAASDFRALAASVRGPLSVP